jgi:membrane-bound lytic murein transglycosylase D
LKIQNRSVALLPLLALLPAIASLLHAPVRAEADALGPDMPSWTIQPYADHDSESRDSEKATEEAVPAPAPAPDPLERTLASAAKAEDLMEAGRAPEALAAIQAALLSLDGASDSQPEVKTLREKLGALRERCEKMAAADEERASSAPSRLKPVKAERNERVDKWIDFYSGRGRDDFQKWLVRSGAYMDLLMHHLRAEGVPEELANLVFVESGFNMHARSVARAVGPWQFIRGTAKIFGLKMTPYVDQRKDPELATRAAARYLRRLYGIFDGSWPLALAAYNSGEGTVLRAMRRQGTDDFWSLRLPRETREYVPQFLAAMEIASDPERYGFELPPNSPFRFDEVLIRGPVDLKHVAGITAIPFDELQQLNPMFVRHRAPAGTNGTSIRVPKGKGDEVQELLQTCYKPKPLSKSELREASRAQRKELRHHPRRHRGKGTHLVRRGETLSGIGKRYGKAPTTLARLNRISDSGQLRAGQRIRIQ